MGQQNSHVQHISTTSFDAVPERRVKPPRPSEPPHRPVSLKPKQPSYAVPENKVLPFALPEKRLRPVSADLSRFHPDYKDIFNSSFEEDDQLIENILNKENEENQKWNENIPDSQKIPLNSIDHHQPQAFVPNGDINFNQDKMYNVKNEEIAEKGLYKSGQQQVPLNTSSNDRIQQSELRRTNTLNVDNRHKDHDFAIQHRRVNSLDRSGRVRGHRRYPSVKTTLTSPENTILEDPSENLDYSRRGDPSMSYSGISLPMQNTFDMDYKYQLTYTQLAEHRRAKHLAEIEKKTGKKLQDLSADLAENTDWGKPPSSVTIKRHHSASVKSSLSDGTSFESTLEKKKKSRAPPPPRQQSASPPRERSTPHLEKQHSAPVPPKRYNRMASPGRYPAADYDMDTSVQKQSLRSNSLPRTNSQREADAIGRINSILNAQPPRPSRSSLSDRNSKKDENTEVKAVEQNQSIPEPPPLPTTEQLDSLNRSNSEIKKQEVDKKEKVILNDTSKKSVEVKSNDNNQSKPVNNLRRMSSLLKHDIISTAQARTTILDKKTTPVPEKPKDPHQVFREQLEKACNNRGARLKDANIDDMIPGLKKHPISAKNQTDQQNTSQVSAVDVNEAGENASKYTDDWAPEDDLSSDDDDLNVTTPKKPVVSEGFKSSIIPTKMKEMKGSKRYIRKQQSIEIDEKNKHGSLRKFKKSVRKGVSNAFGSFSKASGKILRKSKQEETTTAPPETEMNWGLRANDSFNKPDKNAAVRREKYAMSRNSYQMADDESELSSEEEQQTRLKTNMADHKNSFDADVEETDVKEEKGKTSQKMKRAGVAYISKKGEILVLPEYETIQVDESGRPIEEDVTEGRAPKIHNRKKKKFTFETSAKKREREKIEEQLSGQIRDKEFQIEEERQKQLEMELEFRRLRDLENREKFQRYQTAQMQQQLSAALHQQHNLSALTAPQLPPPTGLPNSFGLDYGQFSPLVGQHTIGGNIGLGGLNPIPNGHVYNNSSMLGNIPYNSYMSDYSKLLNPHAQLKTSPQQFAYLLSNMNLSSNPFDGQNYSYSFSHSDPDISTLLPGNKYNSFDKKDDILEKILKSKLPVDILPTTVQTDPVKDESKSSETVTVTQSAKDLSDNIRDNPLYWSSDEEKDHLEGRTVVRSNRSGVVKIQVSDHGDATITDSKTIRKSIDNASTTSSSSQSSPQSHAKIYGPFGFKPVSFEPMKKQRIAFEHEESNDSGISER